MTQEEIIKLAHTAGFNWPDIQATTIEQRLERFASLVAAAEREKFTNTQEFVTLPREAVERALAALDAEDPYRAAIVLRAALDQPQVEQEPVAWMFHAGDIWKFRWHHFNRPMGDDALKYWKPIFTHPQPKREPLTREKIRAIQHELSDTVGCSYETMARAIEAAHNIK